MIRRRQYHACPWTSRRRCRPKPVDTQTTGQDSGAVADAGTPGDVLRFITYEADPPLSEDPSDPLSEPLRHFVAGASTVALAATGQAINSTRDDVLAAPGSAEAEMGTTIRAHGQSL